MKFKLTHLNTMTSNFSFRAGGTRRSPGGQKNWFKAWLQRKMRSVLVTSTSFFVWFVSRIKQILVFRFPGNSDWGTGLTLTFGSKPSVGTDKVIFLFSLSTFSLISLGVIHGS